MKPKTTPIKPGVVFWPLPTEDVKRPHLRVVIAGPAEDGNVLIINLTDYDTCPDNTCCVEVPEYNLLKKKSAAFFGRFIELNAETLGAILATGVGVRHCPNVSAAVLKRLVNGMRESRNVRATIKIKYGLIADDAGMAQVPF